MIGSPGRAGALGDRHAPLTVVGHDQLVPSSQYRGLSSCLATDAQSSADLTERCSVAASCVGQEVDRGKEVVSGVSGRLEVAQGSLWAADGGLELPECAGDAPTRLTALRGAHGNGVCRSNRPPGKTSRQPSLTARKARRISASWSKQRLSEMPVVGASETEPLLISSYIPERAAQKGSWLGCKQEHERPPRGCNRRGSDHQGKAPQWRH